MSLASLLFGGRGRNNSGRRDAFFGGIPTGLGDLLRNGDGRAASSPLDLNRILWSTEKRKLPVSQGAFKNDFDTRVVVAMTHTGDLAVAVCIYDEQGRDVCQLIIVAGGNMDPILLYRAYRLASQVKEITMGDSSPIVAAVTVAAATHEGMTTTLGTDPKKCEAFLRKLIGDDAYNAAITAVPADLADILGKFQEWGVTVCTGVIEAAVEAGTIDYQTVAAYGVESPEARAARKAEREEILLPLRPYFEKYLEEPADNRDARLRVLEEHAVDLASYGFQDTDILLGWALYQELEARGTDPVFVLDSLRSMFMGGEQPKRPCYADRAANLVTQLLDEDPNCRDQVAIRRELAGIEHDFHYGLLEVEQNEPAETLS